MCTITMTSSKKIQHDLTESHISEYKWTLHNFSYCSKPVEPILSSIFFCGSPSSEDTKWQIEFFPNKEEYASIYLKSLNNFQVTLDWEFILSSSKKDYKVVKLRHVFNENETDWGIQCIHHTTLSNEFNMGNEVLIIVCKILINKPHRNSFQLNLSKDISLLFEKKKHYDVILISKDGIEHTAHKAILSCRSEVFSAMFEHDMKEKLESKVKIEDIDNDTLKKMLQFIYTGEIKSMQTEFKKLLIAADKYGLDNLKDICIDHLNESINNTNILNLFEFAQSHNIFSLKLNTAKYFLENKEQIMLTKGLKYIRNLSRSTIENLLYILATNETSVLLENN